MLINENNAMFTAFTKKQLNEEGQSPAKAQYDGQSLSSQPGMSEGEYMVDVLVHGGEEMYQISVQYEGEDSLGVPTLKLPQALVDRIEKAQNEFMEAQSILERVAREQGIELPYGV
jgi:hypothetical protein